jgi:hypothetical protein
MCMVASISWILVSEGIERDMRMTQFQYTKYVVRTSTDLLTSSFSYDNDGVVPVNAA